LKVSSEEESVTEFDREFSDSKITSMK